MPNIPAPERFSLKFSGFNAGAAPLAHLDSLTEIGSAGHYRSASNIDIISYPGLITQGPALAALTAGTEAGAVGELINYIIGIPVSSGITYGIAATKLHKISATAVTNTGIWPHAITGATAGSSTHYFQGDLYYFFNKSSGADIGKYDLVTTFTDAWGSTVPTGAAALQSAPHPVASKQDIMVFGNGRYLGTYFKSTTTLAPTKLDFGPDATVADVCFNANQWLIAVNSGTGVSTDRQTASVFLWDASALTAILLDEVALGAQKIGFLLPIEGVVYIAYQDLSSAGGFCIGYLNGRKITPLRYFTGTLPTFAQKSLYNNTIIFISGTSIYSCGAAIESLPIQISQMATASFGGTIGALAVPFGTPMVAHTLSTSFNLSKFSGYETSCNWRSIIIPIAKGNQLGFIDHVTVLTQTLGSGAHCEIALEANQGQLSSVFLPVNSGKTRFVFPKVLLSLIEDINLSLSWSAGSAVNPAIIRSVQVEGHYVTRP